MAAIVETLEARVLLSSIVVSSTGGGQNYDSTVTASQLDPAHTAVTLRDAINAANNTAGPDTISFDASVFPPNAATPITITLSGGTPLEVKDSSGATTISGPGAGQVVINANGLSTVFEVDPGVSAAITGLTITGGQASVDFGGVQAGGGVYNAGTLVLQNDIITANNSGYYGGGLFNLGTVTIATTTLDHDSAQFGGGFFNSGTATVVGSTLSMNTAAMNGGGFYSLGTATLAGSTLSTNTAGNWGGGFFNNNAVTVSGSTLAHNSAGVYGGGFFNSLTATVTESTLTDNSAQYGGGIMNFSSTTVTASTIVKNFAQFSGGGIYHAGSNAAFFDTIVAQNALTDATPSDWFGGNANSSSADNLFGDGTNTGLVSGGANQNIVGSPSSLIDPHLAALADNGGLTQTMALLAGSPAINAGSNTLVAGLTTDQRGIGFDRIAGGTVDIGAFEIQSHPPAPPTVGSSVTDTSIPTLSGTWDTKNAIVLQVTINGTTYTLGSGSQLTSDGAGHWTLTTSTPIPDGTYAVTVHTVNDIGEVTDVTTPGALLVDTMPPASPTVNSLATNNNMPTLTGTWDQGTPGGAVVLLVTVGGTTYTLGSDPQLTSDGQGHWSLAISTPIPDGTYNVLVHTADAAGNNSDVTAKNALLVDTTPPAAPMVNALITNHSMPMLTGTWDQGTPGGAVMLQVTFNGTTFTLGTDSQLTSDGAGHWRLATTSSVLNGTYGVQVHTADAVGNISDTTAAGAVIVDTTPPASPTVNALITNHSTPILTGTWDQGTPGGATVLQVTVSGTTFTLGTDSQLTSDGSGHWSLTTSAVIPDGTYNVLVHTADAAGNVSDDSATGALIVDTMPPASPTVNALITNHSTPILTGTWDQGTPGGAVVLQVTVGGTTFTLGSDSQLTSDGSGHWTLTESAAIPDGTYNVLVHTADAAGNASDDSATGALIVDTVAPASPTVNAVITNHSTPILTGTWDQGTAGGAVVLQVTVGGTTFTLGTDSQLTSDGSGHWTLTESAAIPDGTYNVLVHTADAAGNVSDDSATGALIVDTVPPASPTVNALITNHSTPILTGTWDQGTPGGAVVLQVTVGGTTFTLGTDSQLTSDGSGHWTLSTSAVIPDGTYNVLVHTADAAGNVADDSAIGALIVDTVPPASPTVNAVITNHSTPILTGTWDQGTAGGAVVLQVTVGGTTFTLGTDSQLTSDGSGHWTLTTSAALADGSYDVHVYTADAAGNVSDLTATGALTVDTLPPTTPTINSLTTTDRTPTLAGTWDPTEAVALQVTISNSAASYSATYTLGRSTQLTANGASWTLNLAGTTPLAVGTFNVVVHTADPFGLSADSPSGLLVINSTPLVVGALTPQSANVGAPVNISTAITGGDTTGLAATITWGDGTTSAGTFATVGGVLTVSGSHPYSSAAEFNIQLTVTNAAGLSTTVATVATITAGSSSADLHVIGGPNTQILATDASASYDFGVQFVTGGVQLTGANGTTFNGLSTLFVANATSISGQLGNGDDHVCVTGTATRVSLATGAGHDDVTLQNFGGAVQVAGTGSLNVHALNSTMSSLIMIGGTSDLFQASNLHVTGSTLLLLGGGANAVQIDDSHLNNFALFSSGTGTRVDIEAGAADGIGTQFDGVALFVVGGGAQLNFSPLASSDQTVFRGSLIILAGSPHALLTRQNVVFARTPFLFNVDVAPAAAAVHTVGYSWHSGCSAGNNHTPSWCGH